MSAASVSGPGSERVDPRRVLVCDDEAHILHAVSFKLAAAGFEVLKAGNGREAMEILESWTPDLVITDCQMPEVDGFGLCRFLRSRPQTELTPVLMLTAKALELDHEIVKSQWRILEVLMKPFSPRALLAAAQAAIHHRAITETV